jgi:hypothetical protein
MWTISAELAILLARAMLWLENVNAFIFGVLFDCLLPFAW